jgi:hypothetical protein
MLQYQSFNADTACFWTKQIILISAFGKFWNLQQSTEMASGWPDWAKFRLLGECFIQGDQIGRIFSHWVIVCSKQFMENYRIIPHLWASLVYSWG